LLSFVILMGHNYLPWTDCRQDWWPLALCLSYLYWALAKPPSQGNVEVCRCSCINIYYYILSAWMAYLWQAEGKNTQLFVHFLPTYWCKPCLWGLTSSNSCAHYKRHGGGWIRKQCPEPVFACIYCYVSVYTRCITCIEQRHGLIHHLHRFSLGAGDLLVMKGKTQEQWQHTGTNRNAIMASAHMMLIVHLCF
jgi:hypothetical protein